MTEPLKPCPFCGAEAEVMIESSYYEVGCKNEDCYATSTWHVERDEVVERWNRRVRLPVPTDDIEQLLSLYLSELDHRPSTQSMIERVRLWLEQAREVRA